MRLLLVLLFLSIAGTSFAEDPLESLNTVEDTVSTMQHTLKLQSGHADSAAGENLSSAVAAGDETASPEEKDSSQDTR